jgi:hypothetical protein
MTYAPRTAVPRSTAHVTAPVRRSEQAIKTGAIAATAAFTGGCVLTQFVTVPHWREMDPQAFLQHFATSGPATGAVLFPIEVASVLLLGYTTYTNLRRGRPGRHVWALATASMVGTVVLLPVYFAGANTAMLDPAFPPETVRAELAAWYRWNWLRTGLGLTATALSGVALVTTRVGSATTAR